MSTAMSDIAPAAAMPPALGEQLAQSYQVMEQRLSNLNEELLQLAEQRLRELTEKQRVTERLESVLNLMPAGVVVLDSSGRVVQCNPAAIEFLGEPLEGEQWRDVIARSFAPRGDDGHEISLRDGRRIGLRTRSFDDGSGQLVVMTDQTETRELQRNLHRHQRLSEMGRMMASLAHQIRTPLSAAMLYAGHLCDSELSVAQTRRFSQKLLSRLNHLEQQVKDMLIFVKGDVKLTDTLTCAALITELEQAMELPINNSRSRYLIDNRCAQALLHCNRESVIGALMNLVNNAIQASQYEAQIIIRARELDGQKMEIAVIDRGPGIDADLLHSLQEPFFTTKAQGTGLGLAVVKAVAEAHHGEFSLQSEPGRGARAVLILPLLADLPAAPRRSKP